MLNKYNYFTLSLFEKDKYLDYNSSLNYYYQSDCDGNFRSLVSIDYTLLQPSHSIRIQSLNILSDILPTLSVIDLERLNYMFRRDSYEWYTFFES